jgi:hypothetical protein
MTTHQKYPMHLSEHMIKAVGGAFAASVSWGAGLLAQAVDQIPQWVKALDTPLIVVGLGYGVVHLWAELRGERNARIADRDAFIQRMEKEGEKGEQSRKELLQATNVQTSVVRDLVRELRTQGLHKPKDGED